MASDASWANGEDLRSQVGYMILFADKDFASGGSHRISPLRWKTYKQERNTQSTLGAELMTMSRAMSEAEWLRSLLGEALNEKYQLSNDKFFREKLV